MDSDLSRGLILWIIKISIELLDQGHINVVIRLPGQGSAPSMPVKLLTELIILRDLQLNIPLREDVHGVHVLFISLPRDLRYKSSGIVGLLRLGGRSSSLPGVHLHQNNAKESS